MSDAQTIISIEDKQFVLNEMKIGRAREFAIKVAKLINELEKKEKKKIAKMEIEDVINKYGDLVFERLTEILNWIFSYKNPDYIPTDQKWFEDNLSIREIKEIAKEIARQNQMDWFTDFFQANFRKALIM